MNIFVIGFSNMLKKAKFTPDLHKLSTQMEVSKLKYSEQRHNILNMHCIFTLIWIFIKSYELAFCFIPCNISWLVSAISVLDDLFYLSNTY